MPRPTTLPEPDPYESHVVPTALETVAGRGELRLLEAVDPDAHRMLLAFIRTRFRAHFGARVPDDTRRLLGVFHPSEGLIAAFGIRNQRDGFFSEHYLGAPLASVLAERLPVAIDTGRVVEVVHFATVRPRRFTQTVPLMALAFSRLGYEHVLCTATRCLIRFFSRRCFSPTILTAAQPDSLPEPVRASWGEYYRTEPVVAFGPLSPALPGQSH